MDLLTTIARIPDYRMQGKIKHRLPDILVMSICSVIGGAKCWDDIEEFVEARFEWFRNFLDLSHGVPSAQTLSRIFSAIDPMAFQRVVTDWFQEIEGMTRGKFIAIDGKSLRGTVTQTIQASPLHIVSAWSQENHLCLGQVAVNEKTNEITAIPDLLALLHLQGAIVTIDAMGCQKSIARDIVSRGGDYVLALKGNHPALHSEVSQRFEGASDDILAQIAGPGLEFIEKGHGRIEIRRYWQVAVGEGEELDGAQDWPMLKTVGIVRSTRMIGESESTETRFFISSLPRDLDVFSCSVRGHWSIESQLHWSLDVTFREDACRVRDRVAAQNISILRKIALTLLKRTETRKKRSLRTKILRAGWDGTFLARALGAGLQASRAGSGST